MSTWKKYIILFAILLSCAVRAGEVEDLHKKVQTLSPEQYDLYKDIAYDLRCPTCTGLSILQSDAPFSLQLRTAVLEEVKQGHKKADVLNFFTQRYGLWILREPPLSGFHLIAWLFPMSFAFIGFGLFYVFFIRRPKEEI